MKAFATNVFIILAIVTMPSCVTMPDTSTSAATIMSAATITSAATMPITQTDRIRVIQSKLIEAGYNPGPVDGVMGSKTRRAISAYQYENNLFIDGEASDAVLQHLQSRYSYNTVQLPTNSYNVILTPAERQLAAEANRRYTATLIGCAAGALGGFLFADAKDKNPVAGGLLGCVAGGALGYAGGEYINARNRNYANQQQEYRSISAGAQADIERYQQTITQARQIRDTYAARIKKLNAEYRAGSITAGQYRSQISGGNESLRNLRTLNQQLEDNIGVIENDINVLKNQGRIAQELQQRAATLREQNLQLETEIAAFSQTLSEVPAEVST